VVKLKPHFKRFLKGSASDGVHDTEEAREAMRKCMDDRPRQGQKTDGEKSAAGASGRMVFPPTLHCELGEI
jgi:hypothetical protein